MKKSILKFGLMGGIFTALMMVATVPFEDKIGLDRAEYLGYTLIVLSFLFVFFGIRSYRESAGQGHITFAKAFTVGLAITVITCLFYVATWEILYFTVLHDFMDKYAAHMIEKAKASGASHEALMAQLQQLQQYRKMYENPLYNSAITFLEPFPVGLAITLISAAILRKKLKSPQPAKS